MQFGFSEKYRVNTDTTETFDTSFLENDIQCFADVLGKEKDFRLESEFHIKHISRSFEDFLYRLVTDLINKSVYSFQASRLRVCIRQNMKCLIVLYGDNGTGFNDGIDSVDLPDKQVKLNLILSRIKEYRGIYSIRSRSGEGMIMEMVFDNVEVKKEKI